LPSQRQRVRFPSSTPIYFMAQKEYSLAPLGGGRKARPLSRTEYKNILDTVDKLALALTEHNHIWTLDERRTYEKSTNLLTKEI
jgi:hypothetical protein